MTGSTLQPSLRRHSPQADPPSMPPLTRARPGHHRESSAVIDHISREVRDLEESARFYDAVFYALGARRMPADALSVAWGVDEPVLKITAGRPDAGHVALKEAGKAAVVAAWEAGRRAGGRDDGAPAARPDEGIRASRACLRDPDGARVELVSR